MAQPNGNGDSSEPSRAFGAAYPDFRLFDSAQDILDHNKRIIKEIKVNHEAQTPEALARNCLLIRELNTNISAVMRAYRSIGDSFSAYMETQAQQEERQRQEQAREQQQEGEEEGEGQREGDQQAPRTEEAPMQTDGGSGNENGEGEAVVPT